MNRLHILIISLFTVALGTGIVVGMGMTRVPSRHDGHSWLSDQLGLSDDQSNQMRAIWEDVRGSFKPRNDARAQFHKERDDGLQAILTPEQKIQYTQVLEHYNAEMTKLNHEQDAEFQAAADRTKKILSDHQRSIYDDLLKKGFRGGPGGPRDGRPGGPPGTRGDRGPGHGPGRGDHGPDHGPDGFGGGPREVPATTSQPG